MTSANTAFRWILCYFCYFLDQFWIAFSYFATVIRWKFRTIPSIVYYLTFATQNQKHFSPKNFCFHWIRITHIAWTTICAHKISIYLSLFESMTGVNCVWTPIHLDCKLWVVKNSSTAWSVSVSFLLSIIIINFCEYFIMLCAVAVLHCGYGSAMCKGACIFVAEKRFNFHSMYLK